MFKCSECGSEYEIMPKYCNCGNDIFINIDEDYIPQEIEDLEDEEIEITKKRNYKQKSFSPIAIGIFLTCIVLSFLILFFIGNPKKENQKDEIDNKIAEQIEIPPIDSYWDNTHAKTAAAKENNKPVEENIIEQIVEQIIPQPKKEIKTVATVTKTPVVKTQNKPKLITHTPAKPNTTNTNQQNVKQTPSKSTPKPNSSQQGMTFEDLTNKIRNQYPNKSTVSTSQTSTVTQAPKPVTNQTHTINNQKATNTTTSTNSTTITNKTQTTSTKPVQTTYTRPQKSSSEIQQELATYKSNLRNTIGKKIDFTKVIGDGECVLSFKINSNGRLNSKAFTKQSSNITLNDAAFNALNTTTSYNPPPEGYKGETLKLTIKFYNGNFEISLN